MSVENSDILKEVEIVGKGHKDINVHIREVVLDWNSEKINAQGKFFYLAYKNGEPAQEVFLEYIYSQIIPFCLERKYFQEAFQKIIETQDHQLMLKLGDEAKNLFINAKKKNNKTGEPGEIVLFTLLEYVLGAPRVLSKMNLKTNRNMEVYGSDGIHLKYDPESNCLYIYWGEAKLYKDLYKSLTRIAASVQSFGEKDLIGKSGRDYDVSLIERHADLGSEEARKALLEYLDPYEEKHKDLKEIFACLSVWDCGVYEEIENEPADKVEEIFKERYKEIIKSACEAFESQIEAKGLNKLQFQFFLIPIKSVYQFRKLFCDKVGIDFKDDDDDENDE